MRNNFLSFLITFLFCLTALSHEPTGQATNASLDHLLSGEYVSIHTHDDGLHTIEDITAETQSLSTAELDGFESVKSCTADMSAIAGGLSQGGTTTFSFYKSGDQFKAKIDRLGFAEVKDIEYQETTVRPLATLKEVYSKGGDISFAEVAVLHAAGPPPSQGGSDEELPAEIRASLFNPGVDLEKIVSVKIYIIEVTGSIGSTSIVEAIDADGDNLGSFLTGFFTTPCE